MIWDYIRDFLVQYIFGGHTSTHDYYGGAIGQIVVIDSGANYFNGTTGDVFFPMSTFNSDYEEVGQYICMGDWLSTTATIIIMCLFVFLFVMLVRWVYKTVVSAFLLR